jgi:hypothetical protein
MLVSDSQLRLNKTLEEEFLPWAKLGELRPVLAHLPLHLPAGLRSSTRSEPLLDCPELHPLSLNPVRWPSLALHACRYPCLGCVLEGETDISMGVTPGMAAQAGDLSLQNHFTVVSMPAQTDLSSKSWRRKLRGTYPAVGDPLPQERTAVVVCSTYGSEFGILTWFWRIFGDASPPVLLAAELRRFCYLAASTRCRSNWNPALPYICRLIIFSRLTWPSS